MNHRYWIDHYSYLSKKFDGELLKQVGKTLNGKPIVEYQEKLIIQDITTILQLSQNDSVIDLCCGNGLITRQLAPLVKEIVGVDFTPGLIDSARKQNSSKNIKYINSDVLHFAAKSISGLKKIVMYEALQHFSPEQFEKLLFELGNLERGSLILFGGIPNRAKLSSYYNTEEKYTYFMRCESEGKPHIGKWWLMDEIMRIVIACGFKPTFLSQDPTLYTAYYRFNVLLQKL